MENAKTILLKMNKHFKGSWDKIYQAIREKIIIDDKEIITDHSYLTLIDNDYPEQLKNSFKPPFVLFYQGDLSLLKRENLLQIVTRKNLYSELEEFVSKIIKKYTLVSYYDNDFDKQLLQLAIKNKNKFILIISTSLDELDKEDEVIHYALENNCLILTEYGFEVDDPEYADSMKYRLIAPFLKGLFILSATNKEPKINLLIEAVNERSGEVFVLPELPFTKSFNNQLIKDGALLVDTALDLYI